MLQVFYSFTSPGQASDRETKMLTKYDFPCNSMQNGNLQTTNGYRRIELRAKLSIFGFAQRRPVLLTSKRTYGKPIQLSGRD